MTRRGKRGGRTKQQKYPQNKQVTVKQIKKCNGVKEGCLCFEFPKSWVVAKYDVWKFVKNDVGGEHLGFNGIKDKGIKSIDFACVDCDESTLWLIEVKDFRKSDEYGKFDRLWDILCNKFLFSMSGLFAARYAAEEQKEKNFATKVLSTHNLRFVLHLELPDSNNEWDNLSDFRADLQQKMEQKFSRVTPNPLVASINNMQSLPWSVTDLSA